MAIITKPFEHNPLNNNVTPAESAKVNANDNAIYNEFNGNITDPNISAVANISQSKILNLIPDLSTIRGQKVQEISIVTFVFNGTYTKPLDLLFARVIAIGAGGGGAGAGGNAVGSVSSGGGGGSGAYAESWLMATSIGASEIVTVGTGGAGGVGPGGPFNGANGTLSQFGAAAIVWANGGVGGFANLNSIGQGGNGGAFGGGAQLNVAGLTGYVGFITTAPFAIAAGGHGGAIQPYGVAGPGLPTATAIGGGHGGSGGGGGGAACCGATGANGGTGGNGIVIVVEFKA